MKCPKCGQRDTKVVDSRLANDDAMIRRRRLCEACGYRFTTFERVESANMIVIKSDNTRETYDRHKVEEGIWRACSKRPISKLQVQKMLTTLEEKWKKLEEIPSRQLGEDVMDALKAVDDVAYIRFASVYRKFKDVDEFHNELKQFLEQNKD